MDYLSQAEPRDAILTARITRDDRKRIRAAAQLAGCTVSCFIAATTTTAATEILEREAAETTTERCDK